MDGTTSGEIFAATRGLGYDKLRKSITSSAVATRLAVLLRGN